MTAAEEFIEFATGASPRLRRTAFLLCGNWHTAEDLTQTTLAKMRSRGGMKDRQESHPRDVLSARAMMILSVTRIHVAPRTPKASQGTTKVTVRRNSDVRKSKAMR